MIERLQEIYTSLEDYDSDADTICKMAVENMQDFSDSELERVFGSTVAPRLCKERALSVKEKYGL